MKAILIVNEKELEVEIPETELNKLKIGSLSGYERAIPGASYYFISGDNKIIRANDVDTMTDEKFYKVSNYYLDEKLARDCARVDKLLRQLRRFSAMHRKIGFNWKTAMQNKYYIYYSYASGCLEVNFTNRIREIGQIYFDSEEVANLAIQTFKEELLWYFREYQDIL